MTDEIVVDPERRTRTLAARKHFENLMAQGRYEEADEYLRALEMFLALARSDLEASRG